MNAAEIRQMLKEAIDEFPERDEMLADLGLQTRHSHLGIWMVSAGLLGLGLGAGAYGGSVLRRVRLARDKRPMILATVGSALLGAGAGASILASLFARRAAPAAIEGRE